MFITVLLNIIKYAGAVGQIALLEGYFDLLDDLEFNQVMIFTNKQEYAKKLNQIIQ